MITRADETQTRLRRGFRPDRHNVRGSRPLQLGTVFYPRFPYSLPEMPEFALYTRRGSEITRANPIAAKEASMINAY